MTIKFNMPKIAATDICADQFKLGVLYRCVRTPILHESYINCVAWKAAKTSEVFHMTENKVYAIMENGTRIDGSYTNGLGFMNEFRFVALPKDNTITLTESATLNIP